ncbi:MAG: hypothetical protein ACPGC0_05240, partial [Opitutales bacterium]
MNTIDKEIDAKPTEIANEAGFCGPLTERNKPPIKNSTIPDNNPISAAHSKSTVNIPLFGVTAGVASPKRIP